MPEPCLTISLHVIHPHPHTKLPADWTYGERESPQPGPVAQIRPLPYRLGVIRPATAADLPGICLLIRAFAIHEDVAAQLDLDEGRLRDDLFGSHPRAEVVVATDGDSLIGFALFCDKYSTLLGQPGLYIDDLFVMADHRGRGLGARLLAAVARMARDRGYTRVEWSVLDSNESAARFYRSLGAIPMAGRTTYRLHDDALVSLAGGSATEPPHRT